MGARATWEGFLEEVDCEEQEGDLHALSAGRDGCFINITCFFTCRVDRISTAPTWKVCVVKSAQNNTPHSAEKAEIAPEGSSGCLGSHSQ